MPDLPYFSLSKHSFEKNSGYKSTVHALAELIDNSVEADASSPLKNASEHRVLVKKVARDVVTK